MKILECIPNVSEGRDKVIINAIAEEVRKVDNVKLLHIDSGYDTNRTVYTFAGDPQKVTEAAFLLIKKATELIDMKKHKGAHPRIGAVDVCPFVPLKDITMQEAVELSHLFAEKVGTELNIPVYCYEHSSFDFNRKNLSRIRKGEYENFAEKMKDVLWKPDFGPEVFNYKSGAIVIGARDILIAYNINLATDNLKIAKSIANKIRESSKLPTSLKGVKAIAWYIEKYKTTQISINITSHLETGIGEVFSSVNIIAIEHHVSVEGSELIGLLPLNSMLNAGKYFLSLGLTRTAFSDEKLIQLVIEKTGLNQITDFEPKNRIIEYALEK